MTQNEVYDEAIWYAGHLSSKAKAELRKQSATMNQTNFLRDRSPECTAELAVVIVAEVLIRARVIAVDGGEVK